jgi:hypothetical protein
MLHQCIPILLTKQVVHKQIHPSFPIFSPPMHCGNYGKCGAGRLLKHTGAHKLMHHGLQTRLRVVIFHQCHMFVAKHNVNAHRCLQSYVLDMGVSWRETALYKEMCEVRPCTVLNAFTVV